MKNAIDITAILVNYNTEYLLHEAIGALKKAAASLNLQIVIVDNNSRDGSVALLQRDFADCELIVNSVNVGFGRANNQALDRATGRYILLLNTDAFVGVDTLEKTLGYMEEHPRCGILGVRLIGRDGVVQPSVRYFPTPWNLFLQRTGLNRIFTGVRLVDDESWEFEKTTNCDWVTGCYYLARREVIDQVGLFDPRFFLYYEEVDHCLAAKKAGWEVVCYPHTSVVHLGGESAKADGEITPAGRQIEAIQIESELLYFRKNHGIAGVWANVIFSILGDAIVLAKRLLRRRLPVGFRAYVKHMAMVWSLFRRTRWGTVPTR